MKIIIKLLIAALVLNATFQAGRAYLVQYQFEDDMQQAALFAGPRPNREQVLARVLEDAAERGIPVGKGDVEVTIDRAGITVTATYSEDVELIPGLYTHRFTFQPRANARLLNP